jgi:hypothetical protein
MPGGENYLRCLCSDPVKCRGSGSRDPRLDTPKATLTHSLMTKQRTFQTRLKMTHPKHQLQIPGERLLQWWCKARRKALNGLQKWIMWESGFVLLDDLRLSKKKQRPTLLDIAEWKKTLVGFGLKSEFYWRQWAPCWCPALIEFLGRIDLEGGHVASSSNSLDSGGSLSSNYPEQWKRDLLVQVETQARKEEGGDLSPESVLSAVSVSGSHEECARHWKRYVMDRGLAKIQDLIQKFFATPAPAVDASGSALSRVRVPDRSYVSAAKRATNQAAKKKNTPFTVVSSHQNKMGLACIRPAAAEKLPQMAGVVGRSEGENGKRAYAEQDNQRKRKKRKKKPPTEPSADVMAASAVAGPEIALAIAAAAAGASNTMNSLLRT